MSRSFRTLHLACVASAVALTILPGCSLGSDSPERSSPPSSPVQSPSSAKPLTAAVAAPSVTSSPSATPDATTSTTSDPFAHHVVLEPTGLNVASIGDSIEQSIGPLASALGRNPDDQSPVELRFGYLVITYGPDGLLDCYSAHPNRGEDLGLTTRAGIKLGSTKSDLEEAYGERVVWKDNSIFEIRVTAGGLGCAADPLVNGEVYELWGGKPNCYDPYT